jgi:hypothetical protein
MSQMLHTYASSDAWVVNILVTLLRLSRNVFAIRNARFNLSVKFLFLLLQVTFPSSVVWDLASFYKLGGVWYLNLVFFGYILNSS